MIRDLLEAMFLFRRAFVKRDMLRDERLPKITLTFPDNHSAERFYMEAMRDRDAFMYLLDLFKSPKLKTTKTEFCGFPLEVIVEPRKVFFP